MAKDLNRSIKIFIDNSDAMKKSKDLEARMEKLRQKLADLDAQGKRGTPEYARTEKALQQLAASYGRYQEKLKETERILKNLSGATETELLAVRSKLRQDLRQTIRNTEEYQAILQTLAAVERELTLVERERSSAMGRNATMWSRMADGFNKYFGVVTSIIAGVTGLSFTLRKLSEDVAKMDDVYSDVMKTTGMTRDQVLDLNETFKLMDTRTARDELNNLARDAGKLGLSSKKDILDFVEAGNQLNVALGEDLGEGAIKNVGKIVNVFAKSTEELDAMDLKGKMLAVGSAINELGASSTASEEYLVSFTGRMGGIATQADITVDQILGYASGLDQNMQSLEMSATALQQLIMKIMGEPTKFAKIAGVEVSEFTRLVKTDMNGALVAVLKNLQGRGGLQQLIPIFKEMGLDGARASQVISALAGNIDQVVEAQNIANKALIEGTSSTKEYSTKNNNLQAILEKSRKSFNDAALELGEKLNPVLLTSTKWTTYLIKALPSLLNFFEKYGKYILYLTVVYGLYVAGIKVAAGIETIYNGILAIGRLRRVQVALATTQSASAQVLYNNVLQNGSLLTRGYTAVTALLSAAKFLLAGNITKAREALVAFQVASKLNPAGLMTTAILALVAAFGYLLYKTSQVVTAQKAIEKATKDLNEELAREQGEANKLFEALKRANPESEEHHKLKKRILELYGPYLKGLIDEKGNLTDIAIAQQTVNTQIRENIALKIKQSATEAIQTDGIKNQINEVDEVVTMLQKQLGTSFSTEAANIVRENIHKAIDKSIAEGKTGMEELTSVITDVVSKESKNMNEKFGFFEPKSIRFQVAHVASAVYNTQKEIKKVEDQFKGIVSAATEINQILDDNNENNNDDFTPDDNKDEKLAAKQKKELDLLLEQLETKHKEKLFQIKTDYYNGDIVSESEYNSKVYAQEQSFYLLREHLLEEFLKKVSDKELKSDIAKQIADIRVKSLDDAIKHSKELEKILLEANPEEKEKQAYESRLRDLQLFGTSKEALLFEISAAETEEEKVALQKKHEALVFLEKQHLDNMVRIRKDAKAKEKASSEEKFEEDFSGRKAELEQEISDQENNFKLNTGMGILTGENAFNAEVELQRKRIALIEEEVAAREKAGADISQSIKKLRKEESDLTQLYVNEYKRRTDEFAQHAETMGNALGSAIANQENLLSAFGGVAVDILFDVLSKIISAEIAKVTAVGTGAIARGTAESMATPGSALTFGAKGFATAAVLTAAITGAMSIAKSALKGLLGKNRNSSSTSPSGSSSERVYSQRAAGKYDVIGEQDGKLYRDVPYKGLATTGVVSTPTLMGEQGAELVVSHPDFKALQKHINYPLIVQAIKDVQAGKVVQRSAGKYDSLPNNTEQIKGDAKSEYADPDLMNKLLHAIENLNDKELKINYYEFENAKKTVDKTRNGAKKR